MFQKIKSYLLKTFLLFVFCSKAIFSSAQNIPAQDTIKLTLAQAENQFVQKNLLLLAQQFNISASKALIAQAKLYPNPNININVETYNPKTQKWFKMTPEEGEFAFQIQQLIVLAGKINKLVKIAEANASLAEYNFYDLLRTLKFTLRNDFFTIYYLQQSARVYDEEIRSLEQISKAFEQQRNKGYIAPVEVIRIKAQLYSLRSEFNDLRNQINDKQSELRLVLSAQSNQYIVPVIDTLQMINQNPLSYSLQSLMDSAYQNRPDLKVARGNYLLSQRNYEYQKALSVPDVTVGPSYDKLGSYHPHVNTFSFGINIPVFNRNQYNIKSYKNLIQYNGLLLQNTEKTIEEQVYRGLEKAIDADKLYQSMDKTFTGEFSQLAKAVFENYQKRNMTLLDFLNFYDSYKQYIVQLNYILQNRATALENINFLIGSNFFDK